jgi:hypothetical protein
MQGLVNAVRVWRNRVPGLQGAAIGFESVPDKHLDGSIAAGIDRPHAHLTLALERPLGDPEALRDLWQDLMPGGSVHSGAPDYSVNARMDVVDAKRWLNYTFKASPLYAINVLSQEMADNFVARVEQLKYFRRSSLSGVFNGPHSVRHYQLQPALRAA